MKTSKLLLSKPLFTIQVNIKERKDPLTYFRVCTPTPRNVVRIHPVLCASEFWCLLKSRSCKCQKKESKEFKQKNSKILNMIIIRTRFYWFVYVESQRDRWLRLLQSSCIYGAEEVTMDLLGLVVSVVAGKLPS